MTEVLGTRQSRPDGGWRKASEPACSAVAGLGRSGRVTWVAGYDVLASKEGIGGLVVDGSPMLEAVGVHAGRWGWLRVRFPFP